jgi:hypothetical protein
VLFSSRRPVNRLGFAASFYDLRGIPVNSLGLYPSALQMKPHRGFVAFLVEVGDFQLAARGDARPGIARSRSARTESPAGSPINCRARVAESARVSSTGSEDSREMNCAWAG